MILFVFIHQLVGYGDINAEFWPEYVIAIILMLSGAFLMAIPLSVITRHFGASYALLAEKQVVKRRALQSFALHHRKSSAFTVAANSAKKATENMGRRVSLLGRRNSTAPAPDAASETENHAIVPGGANGTRAAGASFSSGKKSRVSMASKDIAVDWSHNTNGNSEMDDTTGVDEDSAEHRTLAVLKKHLSFGHSAAKDSVDARALANEYQVNTNTLFILMSYQIRCTVCMFR